jgi:hypothetical protein
MDLLDRYLQAVKFFLAKRRQDDILRELSENLISEMEDREQDLGRPLTEAEQADILRRHGHPLVVAGRYGSRQLLIGPTVFPLYLFVLKSGLAAALLVTVVLGLVTSVDAADPAGHAVQALLAYPGRALMVFAWTTLWFAGFDLVLQKIKIRHDWDPRQLPKVTSHTSWLARQRALFELLLIAGYVVWLLLIPGRPFLLLGPLAEFVAPGPAWHDTYAFIVLVGIGNAAVHLLAVVRPEWTRARSLGRIAISAATLTIVLLLLRGGDAFVARAGVTTWSTGHPVEGLTNMINAGCRIGFSVAAFLSVLDIFLALRRLQDRLPNSPNSQLPTTNSQVPSP